MYVNPNNKNSSWWLRTPINNANYNNSNIITINSSGDAYGRREQRVSDTNRGFVPALTISFN